MNVLCYMQPHRGGGVARHANTMVKALMRREGVDASLMTSRSAWKKCQDFAQLWDSNQVRLHPYPERLLESLWKFTNWPKLRRYVKGVDWVYAPVETRLPFTTAKTAITVHDIQAFETDLPWSNTPDHLRFRKKWSLWLPRAIQQVDCVLTVSEFSKKRMVELLDAEPEKIKVIGNGVDPVFYAAGERQIIPGLEHPSVVIIGGLRTKKGAEATLAVAAELQAGGSPLVLDIIGQHDADWAERAKAYTNVCLHGRLADEEIASRLACSVALLFLSPYEGFGIPALEAMAAGTPAVVANCASLPEVVGSAGILVDPDATSMIATTLEQLRCDPATRDDYVVRGRGHASNYTWAHCVDRLMQVFEG